MAKVKLKKGNKENTNLPVKRVKEINMQPKKPIGLKKAPKLPVKRVYEIADSLRNASGYVGVGSPLSTLNKKSTAADSASAWKSAFDRLDEAERNQKEYKRLKSLADKASKKK